jgi:beta-lactamase superfamily II metal-dependent hydrolase
MLKLHFLNVGHGDCKIIENTDTGRTTMIDINMSSDMEETTNKEILSALIENCSRLSQYKYHHGMFSDQEVFSESKYYVQLQNPINYLSENGIDSIFRFISTHPHMDHITGLSDLYKSVPIGNMWALKNTFRPPSLTKDNQDDWELYRKMRDCTDEKYDDVRIVRPTAGNTGDFWSEDGIEILSPNEEIIKLAKENDNPNIMSYVLLLTYGGHKIVFGGDAEQKTWEYIYSTYRGKIQNISILDASHHGRDSGYYQPAVKLMSPKFTIVSVGKKPDTDASNKYRQYSNNVFSTRWKGNIKFNLESDGKWNYETQNDS